MIGKSPREGSRAVAVGYRYVHRARGMGRRGAGDRVYIHHRYVRGQGAAEGHRGFRRRREVVAIDGDGRTAVDRTLRGRDGCNDRLRGPRHLGRIDGWQEKELGTCPVSFTNNTLCFRSGRCRNGNAAPAAIQLDCLHTFIVVNQGSNDIGRPKIRPRIPLIKARKEIFITLLLYLETPCQNCSGNNLWTATPQLAKVTCDALDQETVLSKIVEVGSSSMRTSLI